MENHFIKDSLLRYVPGMTHSDLVEYEVTRLNNCMKQNYSFGIFEKSPDSTMIAVSLNNIIKNSESFASSLPNWSSPLQTCVRLFTLVDANIFDVLKIFLEPGESSLHAKVSRFLQPSFQKSRSCASILFNPLSRIPFSSTPIHLFLGLPFFEPLI